MRHTALALAALFMPTGPSIAGEDAFATGPVIEEFGPHAAVEGRAEIPDDATFKVSFDTSKKADAGAPNRTLASAARFINMHAAAGADPANINLAIVIHGKAVEDVTHEADGNLALIAALTAQNVRIIVCGQSAVYYGVTASDLAPGVEMALSAMTARWPSRQ